MMKRLSLGTGLPVLVILAFLGSGVAAQISTPATTVGQPWRLEDIVTAALAQHPVVEAARARVDVARGTRRTAGTLPNPVATYAVEDTSFPGQGRGTRVEPERSAYLTFPIETLFQRKPRTDRADEGIRAAEADLAAAERRTHPRGRARVLPGGVGAGGGRRRRGKPVGRRTARRGPASPRHGRGEPGGRPDPRRSRARTDGHRGHAGRGRSRCAPALTSSRFSQAPPPWEPCA